MFSQKGCIVKAISRLLYKLLKVKKLQRKIDKFFSFPKRIQSQVQKFLKVIPFTSSRSNSRKPSASKTYRVSGKLAWGKKVSPEFLVKVEEISRRLNIDPNFLMACMAFETAETFSPAIKNGAGSGATGLIQFMPATAKGLRTCTKKLAKMKAIDQLDYVEAYFKPYRNRMRSLEDVYMAILYPAAIGKPASHVLFKKGTIAYRQNAGLDRKKLGNITIADASYQVRTKLEKGLQSNLCC
nr:transglycosylase SLT domain-containing protein [Vibrio nigripulchritudo]